MFLFFSGKGDWEKMRLFHSKIVYCRHSQIEIIFNCGGWCKQRVKMSNMENNTNNLACSFFSGQPIPRVEYTPEEIKTWGEVFKRVVELLPGRYLEAS